tara:strand:+ start:139 stop:771 length:633 start_codon:yes stop_codon:yes gene_type:complete
MKFNRFNILGLAVLVTVFMSACGGGAKEQSTTEEPTESTEVAAADYAVDSEASTVAWKGEVAGVYGHNGVIDIKEGTISGADGKITGGTIVIDMTTIQPLDSASYSEEHPASDLVGHLSTGDFFLVEEFPTASFTIKSHEGDKLVGDLTVRGITNEETVDLSSVSFDGGFSGSGVLVFDRQKYDVKWEHYVEDYVLSDDIEIKLEIVASK